MNVHSLTDSNHSVSNSSSVDAYSSLQTTIITENAASKTASYNLSEFQRARELENLKNERETLANTVTQLRSDVEKQTHSAAKNAEAFAQTQARYTRLESEHAKLMQEILQKTAKYDADAHRHAANVQSLTEQTRELQTQIDKLHAQTDVTQQTSALQAVSHCLYM